VVNVHPRKQRPVGGWPRDYRGRWPRCDLVDRAANIQIHEYDGDDPVYRSAGALSRDDQPADTLVPSRQRGRRTAESL